MISSINFLFLIALAVTSWVILCYFGPPKEQRGGGSEINMEINMAENVTPPTYNYDICLNFLCIFACIYGLAKLTQLTENCIGEKMKIILGLGHSVEKEPTTIEDYRVKLVHLERENAQLELHLKQLKHRYYLLVGKPELPPEPSNLQHSPPTSLSSSQPTTAPPNQNIFISNRHIHLNRQVHMNEGVQGMTLSSDFDEEGGDFSKIWQKYLFMQKHPIQMANLALYPPVVISTEELQSVQGTTWI